jgi:hypothetical protein
MFPLSSPQDDKWLYMEQRYNGTDRRNRLTQRKTFPSAILCPPQIPYWLLWERTRASRSEKSATNNLCYWTV